MSMLLWTIPLVNNEISISTNINFEGVSFNKNIVPVSIKWVQNHQDTPGRVP